MPEVSVVIPAYNAARYLPDAVDSVLSQTYRDVEILVIDDGSTDGTAEVMTRYGPPVRYLPQKNGGVSVARNNGIAQARGRYVAFLDADDTWLPHKLERQLAQMATHPDKRVCYSAFVRVDQHLQPLGVERSQRRASALEDLLFRGNVVGSICTVVAERSLFATVGGFDPGLSQCADWDMWVRLAVHTDFLYMDEPLVTYRQHDTNMSRNAPLLETDSRRVLEKGFSLPDLPPEVARRRTSALGRNFMVLAGTYFHAGHYGSFLRCAARSLLLNPARVTYLFGFPLRRLYSLTKRSQSTDAQVLRT